MPAACRSSHLVIGLLLALFLFSCTTTITKVKNPVFVVLMDSLGLRLDRLAPSQHFNLDGRELTINGRDSSVLEIDVINGRNIPADDAPMKALGRSIAVEIHNALKDKNEYKAVEVLFVKVDSGSVVTKRTWKGFAYPVGQL